MAWHGMAWHSTASHPHHPCVQSRACDAGNIVDTSYLCPESLGKRLVGESSHAGGTRAWDLESRVSLSWSNSRRRLPHPLHDLLTGQRRSPPSNLHLADAPPPAPLAPPVSGAQGRSRSPRVRSLSSIDALHGQYGLICHTLLTVHGRV